MTALWLLDLDDTLFEASGGMLVAIHLRMNAFIRRRFEVSDEEAGRLRTQYWKQFGSTFLGLWKNHGVDPEEFLTEVHDFDLSPYAEKSAKLCDTLRRLPGRKVVFTNGPRNYAERVVRRLGILPWVELVSSSDMRLFRGWRPKPSISMLEAVCRTFRSMPSEAVLVDDSLMNLRAAKRAGLHTVWCTGARRRHGKIDHLKPIAYVDLAIREIGELPKWVGRLAPADFARKD